MEDAWERSKQAIVLGNAVDTSAKTNADPAVFQQILRSTIREVVGTCNAARKRARALEKKRDLSDAQLSKRARHTDHLPLLSFQKIMHLVPRLVNVVTVCYYDSNLRSKLRQHISLLDWSRAL